MGKNPEISLSNQEDILSMELAKQKNELLANTQSYVIQKWETIASIAQKLWIHQYTDLLLLNTTLGRDIPMRGKNPLIRVNDEIYIPKDTTLFSQTFERVRKLIEAEQLSARVANHDRSVLKKNLRDAIFPKNPVSIGPKMLEWFIEAQEASFNPRLPRIVDHSRQENVSCANLIRTLMTQSIHMGDASRAEKTFFQKQNVDAWMLPSYMREIGFLPKVSLMDAFDGNKILEQNPIKEWQEESYKKRVIELWKTLETSAPFSLVPLYFTGSHWKWEVARWNAGKEEKHYNTHQSMLLWNANLTLKAHEVPLVQNGKLASFWDDTKRITLELANQEWLLVQMQKWIDGKRKKLLDVLDFDQNKELSRKANAIDAVIRRYGNSFPEDVREWKIAALKSLFESENKERIKTELAKIIRYPVTEEDANYIVALQSRKRRIHAWVEAIHSQLEKTPHSEISRHTFEGLSEEISAIPSIKQSIGQYLSSLESIRTTEQAIAQKKTEIQTISEQKVARVKELEQANLENIELGRSIGTKRDEHKKIEQRLLDVLNPAKNEELQTYLSFLENKAKDVSGESERKRKLFLKAIQVDDRLTLERVFWQSREDQKELRARYLATEKTKASISEIRSQLTSNSGIRVIAGEKLAALRSASPQIEEALSNYNESAEGILQMEKKILQNKEKLEKKEELPITAFLVHFVASRADYSSAWTKLWSTQIEKHLEEYSDLIHLSINGKPVSLKEEWKKPKKEQIQISPEDQISLSGPLMVDGWHLANSEDKDERANMNARSRFFFELIGTGKLLPTELIEPNKESIFRRESYNNPASWLKTKWVYDLRFAREADGSFKRDTHGRKISENIESVLKTVIPQFEKEAFANLDLTKEEDRKLYEERLQAFYSRQIKALELSGYLQSETELNNGSTNVNRSIPYFETTGVNTLFREYVQSAREKQWKQALETAPFRSHIEYTVFPGDSSGTIINGIMKELRLKIWQSGKYENISLVEGMNLIFSRALVEKIIDQSLRTHSQITGKDVLAGKAPMGFHVKIHLNDVNALLAEMKGQIQDTTSVDSILKPHDRSLLDVAIQNPYNRSLVKQVLVLESYERPTEQWYKPEWLRRKVKQSLESESLKSPINSYGDFQIRIKWLSSGWNKEWPTRAHIARAIEKLDSKEIRDYMYANARSWIASDMEKVDTIKWYLAKKDLEKSDFEDLTRTLLGLFRLDDGKNENMVGKIIAASLMEDKLNIHAVKLDGIMEKIGEDRLKPDDTPDRISWFNNTLLLMNNLGERKVLYGLTENYILRILENLQILKENGKALTAPEIETKFFSGAMVYGPQTFIRHIGAIRDQIALSLEPKERSTPELAIYHGLMAFNNRVYEIETKNISNKEKEVELISTIYAFLSDKELRWHLDNYAFDAKNPEARISSSILPKASELSGNSFRNGFFNYPRKQFALQNSPKTLW